ncbi:DUF3159 domain-containing protein [Thalassiella azotivora]
MGSADGEPSASRVGDAATRAHRTESLADVLGGRRSAVDATVPPVLFAAVWWVSDGMVGWSVGAAVAGGAVVSLWRLRRGVRPRAAVASVLAVVVAGLVAVWTGRGQDFFLLQLLANAASALTWVLSLLVRWPLLGVVVGALLGQGARWRRDPALLRGYGRASWVWVAQYGLRLAVLVPLYLTGEVLTLAVARVALTWPLVAACTAVSWWVLVRSLPPGHPGVRHPVTRPAPLPDRAARDRGRP